MFTGKAGHTFHVYTEVKNKKLPWVSRGKAQKPSMVSTDKLQKTFSGCPEARNRKSSMGVQKQGTEKPPWMFSDEAMETFHGFSQVSHRKPSMGIQR